MLVTLLLHGAGFRESEPFHLYIPDVFPDPTNPTAAKVFIHHPSYGAAPADWRDQRGRPRKGNRAEYLGHQFGLVPRTELMDRRHAGWKGGMHDGAYYKQAYWFLPEYGEWFLHLWHRYLEQVARVERNHPLPLSTSTANLSAACTRSASSTRRTPLHASASDSR
jgi:hypothetical protein